MANTVEVIKPFSEVLAEGHLPRLQIIGGIGSMALSHPNTIIDIPNRSLIMSDAIDLPTRRPDGSLRDVDVLVMSGKRKKIKKVEESLMNTIDNQLELSVFGIKSGETLQRQIAHPLGFTAFKTFVSDRYKTDDGMVKSLFPFVVPIDLNSLETWSLHVQGMVLPVPHPAMSLINYTNRSISGVRPKDESKVEYMVANTLTKAPELKEWAIDGPGASQVLLGQLLQQLTPYKQHVAPFGVISRLDPEAMMSHESFMLPDATHRVKQQVLAIAIFKANCLAFFESHPSVVSLWRKIGERNIDFIIKNT